MGPKDGLSLVLSEGPEMKWRHFKRKSSSTSPTVHMGRSLMAAGLIDCWLTPDLLIGMFMSCCPEFGLQYSPFCRITAFTVISHWRCYIGCARDLQRSSGLSVICSSRTDLFCCPAVVETWTIRSAVEARDMSLEDMLLGTGTRQRIKMCNNMCNKWYFHYILEVRSFLLPSRKSPIERLWMSLLRVGILATSTGVPSFQIKRNAPQLNSVKAEHPLLHERGRFGVPNFWRMHGAHHKVWLEQADSGCSKQTLGSTALGLCEASLSDPQIIATRESQGSVT